MFEIQQQGVWTNQQVYYIGDAIWIYWSCCRGIAAGDSYLLLQGPYTETINHLPLQDGQYFIGYAGSRDVGFWTASLYVKTCSDTPPITCGDFMSVGSARYEVRSSQPPPNASSLQVRISATSPTNGVFPLKVYFTSQVSGGIQPYHYRWDFGDGSPSSDEAQTSHTYEQAGSYTVRLTVSDSSQPTSQAASSNTIIITVGTNPSGNVQVRIDHVENLESGTVLQAVLRTILHNLPSVGEVVQDPVLWDNAFFSVVGSSDIAKLIVEINSPNRQDLDYPSEIIATPSTEPNLFWTSGGIGAHVKVTDEQQRRALVVFTFSLASDAIEPYIKDPYVAQIVSKIISCYGPEIEKQQAQDFGVYITEVIPVLKDGTRLAPTYFTPSVYPRSRLETFAEGMRREPETVKKALDGFTSTVGCSSFDLLVTTSVGRVGSLYQNGVLVGEVDEIPGAFYSGHGTHPQLIIIPRTDTYTITVNAFASGTLNLYAVGGTSSGYQQALDLPSGSSRIIQVQLQSGSNLAIDPIEVASWAIFTALVFFGFCEILIRKKRR